MKRVASVTASLILNTVPPLQPVHNRSNYLFKTILYGLNYKQAHTLAKNPFKQPRVRSQVHPNYFAFRAFGGTNKHARSPVTSSCAAMPQEVSLPVDEPPAHFQRLKSNFCRLCGSKMTGQKPEGEREWRHVCSSCGYIDYFNPRMVVGCIVEHEGKVLLARRAIEPCRGKWTVPAGYMELHESTAEGAARETREEVNAAVNVVAPYCHWDIPLIGQAYILFRAQLAAPFTFSPGPESLETALFLPEDIPFESIAFSSVSVALRCYLEDLASGRWRTHHGVIDKQPGSGPNDPGTFYLRDHYAAYLTPAAPAQQGGEEGAAPR